MAGSNASAAEQAILEEIEQKSGYSDGFKA